MDDEKVILDTLAAHITKSHLGDHFQIEQAESGDEAIELIQSLLEENHRVAVVVSDQLMPRMSGDELLAEIHAVSPDTQNILLTGNAQIESVIAVINKARLFRYLPKPWDKNDLILTIDTAGTAFINKVEHDEQNRLLAKLYEATALLNSTYRVDQLMEAILGFLLNYFKASNGAILLSGTEDDNTYKIKSLQTIVNEDEEEVILPMEERCFPEAMLEYVFEHQKAYFNDFVTPNSLPDFLKKDLYIIEKRPKTILGIPLKNQDEVVGMIYFDQVTRYKAFTHEMEQFWELFAPNASIAISNTMLYESLNDKSQKLTYQKQLVEEKIGQITDSIKATERIQKALMIPPQSLNTYFQEAGMIFKPRDIVSGDFYWVSVMKDKVLIAAADCTGHGIPGAMISVLGINLLDRIVNVDAVYQPDHILKLLDEYVKRKLQQENNELQSLDGMDICLVAYDIPSKTIEMASAGRPLIIQHKNGTQDIYKGDKFPIGGQDFFGAKDFQLHTIALTDGDTVFMFSDGITDQFGGKNADKKFTLSRLQTIISDLATMPLERVFTSIQRQLADWQGEASQTDDILLLAFRI